MKTIDLEFRNQRTLPRGRRSPIIEVSRSDYEGLFNAIQNGDASAQDLLQRVGLSVARSTYCPAGPIRLNNGRRSYRPGEAERAVSAINADPERRRINVLLKCDTVNPYYSPERLEQARQPGPTQAQLRAQVVGKTELSVSRAHGTQVEFLSPDGGAYLWYPGNTRVNAGQWRIRKAPGQAWTEICFSYGPLSYNPVTRQRGVENCEPAAVHLRGRTDVRDGDLFGLRSGNIPFVLPRQEAFDFQSLLQQAQ